MLSVIYHVINKPLVYNLIQTILGGKRVYAFIQKELCKRLTDIPPERVLDVGCGTGTLAESFTGQYFGLDINPEYIKKARATCPGSFICGDATSLPFQSDYFSLVFTFGVLHHLDFDSRTKMLREMWRVCIPGGRLFIIDGLIPSNKANILGYILAKLDRGRFKMRSPQFEAMIESSLTGYLRRDVASLTIFPYEYIFVELVKSVNSDLNQVI